MMRLLRLLALVMVATLLTGWILAAAPPWIPGADRSPAGTRPLLPAILLETIASSTTDPGVDTPSAVTEPAGMTPTPERGTPEGAPEHDRAPALDRKPTDEAAHEERIETIREIMRDEDLLSRARDELASPGRQGFETSLRCRPEDQLALARFFGEEILLLPRSALDPSASRPISYVLDTGDVARVRSAETSPHHLEARRYRDLFDFEYSRLPAEIRELRRQVVARDDIALFAALIPPREWALVVQRREEALARAGLEAGSPVRRFILSYVPLGGGAYDLRVDEILLADGTRIRPDA